MFSCSTLLFVAALALNAVSALPHASNSVTVSHTPNTPNDVDAPNIIPELPNISSVPGVIGDPAVLIRDGELPDILGVSTVPDNNNAFTASDILNDFPTSEVLRGFPTDMLSYDNAPKSIAAVLTIAQSQLKPVIATLKGLTQGASPHALAEPMSQISDILNSTIDSLRGLIGRPIRDILASVEGDAPMPANELAQLIANITVPVFEALGVAVPTTGGHVSRDITDPLFGGMGGLFTILYSILGMLLGNVLGDVAALLVPIIEGIDPFLPPINGTTVSSLYAVKDSM